MLIEEVKDYFAHNASKMQRITGVNRNSMRNWEKKGYIPIQTQVKLERLTEGKLKARLEDCNEN